MLKIPLGYFLAFCLTTDEPSADSEASASQFSEGDSQSGMPQPSTSEQADSKSAESGEVDCLVGSLRFCFLRCLTSIDIPPSAAPKAKKIEPIVWDSPESSTSPGSTIQITRPQPIRRTRGTASGRLTSRSRAQGRAGISRGSQRGTVRGTRGMQYKQFH